MAISEGRVLIYFLIAGFVLVGCGPKLANGEKCPSGTEIAGAAPPNGIEQWCQRMDKNRNSINDGFYLAWYQNGQKKFEAKYKDGKLEGFGIHYYPNGQIEQMGEFRNGKEEGLYTFWRENGQKKAKGEFRNGKQEGHWTFWLETNPTIRALSERTGTYLTEKEGEFKDGKMEGIWTFWYESGKKMAVGELRKGKKEGTWTIWNERGPGSCTMEYKDDQQIGPDHCVPF